MKRANGTVSMATNASQQCYAAPFVRCGNTPEEELKEIENFITRETPGVQNEAVRRYVQEHPEVKITLALDDAGLIYPPEGLPRADKVVLDKTIAAELENKRKDFRAQLRMHGGVTPWHPLFNLHVHAKRTHHYVSSDWPCECREAPYPIEWTHGRGNERGKGTLQ